MLPQTASTVTIYQPTADEVISLMDAARNTWPQLISRIDRAQEIVLSGGITLEPTAWNMCFVPYWRIASQSRENGFYIIPGGMACRCPDEAPTIGERRFCKHSIALACYLRILRNKLNTDIQRFAIEPSVLGNGELLAYAKRLGCVKVHNVDDVYHFANHASPAHYAIWLAAQQPVPVVASAVEAVFA